MGKAAGHLPAIPQGGEEMDAEWNPSDSNNDIVKIFEAHSLIPSGPLFDEALGVVSLYADRIRKRLEELPASVSSEKPLLAILERGTYAGRLHSE